jgi:hypothetical protein
MEKVNLGRDNSGKLTYETSRGGIMYDISNEVRSKAIDLEQMTKKLKPIFKSLYVIKHKVVVPMARLEDTNIDLIYLNRHNKHAIFVHPESEVKWDNKKI